MSAIKALLLTDVVDSTRLAEKLGDDAMAEIWAAHDRVSRALLGPWRGREIDKTDGMLLLFDDCADAVGYALEYHAALATLPTPLAARVGLHVGPVILRENAADDIARGAKPLEVEGLAKPIAARVMALARGGQTLLSAAAREALGTCAHKLVSHGHWRIKGVSDPVELFEIGAADAQFAPPGRRREGASCRLDGRLVAAGQRDPEQPAPPGDVVHRPRSRAGGGQEPARRSAPADPGRHGRAGQDPPLAADRGRADPRLSRRRLVPRPGADQRPGPDRQRRRRRCSACARSPISRCCRRCARTSGTAVPC